MMFSVDERRWTVTPTQPESRGLWTQNEEQTSGRRGRKRHDKQLFFFEFLKKQLQLGVFLRTNTRKRQTKRMAVDPPDRRFINSQRPIKIRNMEPTFELCPLDRNALTFDLTSPDRKIEGATLPLLLVLLELRKGASELSRKPGLNSSLFASRWHSTLHLDI